MKWIEVDSKRLPKEREDVLVHIEYLTGAHKNSPKCRIGYLRIWSDSMFFVVPKYEGEPPYTFKVTHWMPLIPPKKEDEVK